jgi:hypothetical protein
MLEAAHHEAYRVQQKRLVTFQGLVAYGLFRCHDVINCVVSSEASYEAF